MQEEVENRTVNLAISTTKLTFRTIVNGYNAWKRHHQAIADIIQSSSLRIPEDMCRPNARPADVRPSSMFWR